MTTTSTTFKIHLKMINVASEHGGLKPPCTVKISRSLSLPCTKVQAVPPCVRQRSGGRTRSSLDHSWGALGALVQLPERKNENVQPKRGMGGRHAATTQVTQGFHGKEGVLLAVAHWAWSTWSTWSAVGNLTSRAGELRSAPSGPDDRHRVAGKRALAPGGCAFAGKGP